MTFTPGVRLGPYEILSAIGAGGMGEVYRARDTRLDRMVAIKILPEALAGDPQFRERFDREARTVAALNHPHICALYDIGDESGTAFLVLEYLEGETLADRLAKGRLPIDQALAIAIQIAEALDKAHRAGIIHRDLKPGNIMLTKSGAKLLDFGLAKTRAPVVASAGLSMLPTTPANLTAQGTILGTFQYMAPEQLEGQEADARTDIFAFGAIVYEMLTGKKAFEGKSHASLIAAILEHEPPAMSSLQPLTPSALERSVKKCLAKDPDDRWQTARDLLDELKWVAATPSQVGAPFGDRQGEKESRIPRHGRGRAMVAVSGLVIGALAATAAAWILLRPVTEPPRAVSRFTITLSPNDQFSAVSGQSVALSPDGTHLVYVANKNLYLRAMDQLEPTPIRGTEVANLDQSPFFSPDGQWIGFWQNNQLKKVSVNGGAPVPLCSLSQALSGATWGPDDTIVFGQGSAGIWRVSGAGGTPEVLIKVDAGQSAHAPELLPGGRNVLFTLASGNDWDQAQVVMQSLDTGKRQTLIQGSDARYVSTGHLIYALRGTLLAAPFDLAALKLTGSPVPLVEGVWEFAVLTPSLRAAAHFSLSRVGSLVYIPSAATPNRSVLVWVDRQGHEEAVPAPARAYDYPRISPDGTRVALDVREQNNDIWVWDFARTTLNRLTSSPGFDNYPIWTPDGRYVVFASDAGRGLRNLFRRAPDGSGPIEQLTKSPTGQIPYSFSPDGKSLVYRDDDPKGYNLGLSSMEGSRVSVPLLHTPFNELNADLSPDGRWMVYQSDESGQNEIYVRPFPRVDDGRWQVSTGGGAEPVWARGGRELFYVASGGRVMAVSIQTQPTFASGSPQLLFGRSEAANRPYGGGGVGRHFDVAPDGKRFLMTKPDAAVSGEGPGFIVVQNWTEELKRRVPTNK